jgi:hypothetical protein
VGEWLSNLPTNFDSIEERSCKSVLVSNESTVYDSITEVLFKSGKTGVRREWSDSALKDFQEDWKFDIEMACLMHKKPTLTGIRLKLSEDIRLRVRWAEMSETNIKDKIWVEAQRLKKLKSKQPE